MRQRLGRALIFAALVGLGIAIYLLVVSRTGPADVVVLDWPENIAHPGGWSGLEMSADGTRFWAIHDNAGWAKGTLDRAEDGTLRNATLEAVGPLRDPRGAPLTEPFQDSEGLALTSFGTFIVSFEWQHRLWTYRDLDAPAQVTLPDPRFWRFRGNAGPEAVALTNEDGALTFRERSTTTLSPRQSFILQGGSWRDGPALPAPAAWSAVGADTGPDGMLYILERRFRVIGFATRIRRMDLTAADPAATVETVFTGLLGRYGNLEGIALWPAPDGTLRALMVSDNNHNWFQREHLVEVTLPLAEP